MAHQAAVTGLLTMEVVAAQSTDPGKPVSQADELARLRDLYSAGRFSASAAKIFLDGVLEGRTAALLEPYHGRSTRPLRQPRPCRPALSRARAVALMGTVKASASPLGLAPE